MERDCVNCSNAVKSDGRIGCLQSLWALNGRILSFATLEDFEASAVRRIARICPAFRKNAEPSTATKLKLEVNTKCNPN